MPLSPHPILRALRAFLAIFVASTVAFPFLHAEGVLTPLNPLEADAIVQAEADARAEAIREFEARGDFYVLSETVVSHGENRTIYRRVLPPVVDPISTPPRVAPAVAVFVSEADLPESITGTQVLALSAMIYPDGVTRLDWKHEDQAYTAWSNIDFRYLRPVGQLTTPDQHFLVVLSIEEASPGHPAQPTLPSFTPGRAEYLILTDTPETALDPAAFTGLDALHAHYESNETQLKTQHQRNEALNAARQRHHEANPPEPQDPVIHFWRKMQNGDK